MATAGVEPTGIMQGMSEYAQQAHKLDLHVCDIPSGYNRPLLTTRVDMYCQVMWGTSPEPTEPSKMWPFESRQRVRSPGEANRRPLSIA